MDKPAPRPDQGSVKGSAAMTNSGTRDATMAVVEFRVLGPLEVVGPAGPIAIASGRQRAILALLILELGRTVSTDRLIDEVWGDEPPASVRQALRVHIAGLRKALGPGRIETRPSGYRMAAEDASVDLTRFEALLSEASHAVETGHPE